MSSKVQEFVSERTQFLSEKAQNLRKAQIEVARAAALRSARRIKSLNNPVRAFARSGVRLTAISQGTAQSLIELQEQIVSSALSNAATRLERAAQTQDVRGLLRDQTDVLRATRNRIVTDMAQAVAIFKAAGGDVRKVATETYTQIRRPAPRKRHVAKTPRRRKVARAVRKSTTRGRKARS